MKRPQLDTLRNRLVLLIFAITAAAIGFVYLYIVPQLESSLTTEKLSRLERLGSEQSPAFARSLARGDSERQLNALVRMIGQNTESRVTLIGIRESAGGPRPGLVIADSQDQTTAIQGDYRAAHIALEEGRISTGVDTIAGDRVGTSAVPVSVAGDVRWVAVLSDPLAEVQDNVDLIRRQILIGGAIALVGAVLVAFWASSAVSRRLRRLRRAAEQVADGNFSHPIPIDSSDELGQLARTFNDMQHRLERLDSARKDFIANASHELRTPIFSLGGFVELLEEDELNTADRRQFIGEMRAQIDRLQKLTADLLDLSKLDADAMELNVQPVDLKELSRSVAGEFRQTAKGHGSSVEVRGRGQAVARADADRASQIIRILIDNAIMHTPEGTKVTVTAVRGGDAAEVVVGDDGRGIEPRSVERVFERFFTGDVAAGSGLGLAIGQELATRMGGDLDVVSQRGFTAFTLKLPLAEPAAERPRAAGAAA
ncbi:MAG: sensor histidine kinase [Solirubrobacterales bacterium]|nr:sensor histidine kinase [Solirubrobacterales bacterium]